MQKRPISIIIDDPAPGIHLYRHHIDPPFTNDGRRLLDFVPNEFLYRFADVAERNGLKGKFSVVPMAGCQGSLYGGFTGVSDTDLKDWISTVQERIMPRFAICSEILSHSNAYDAATGTWLPENEQEWVREHSAEEIRDYVALSLRMLDQAGLTPTGVTSPWATGIEVEDAYRTGISLAFEQVFGRKDAWYFLHTKLGPDVKPTVWVWPDGRRIASIHATFHDGIWQTIDTADTSDAFVRAIADSYITGDGSSGCLVDMLKGTGWPVLLTHWQSLFSNGSMTGLRALDLIGSRIREHLSDRVEWVDFTELMNLALAETGLYEEA